jgi:hypothetical protein
MCVAALTLFLLAQVLGEAKPDPCGTDLESWLRCNNPQVIHYLMRFQAADVGRVLEGVRLSDGSFAAKGYRYLGRADDLGKGAHVVLVEREGKEGAYIWVEENGSPLPLPECGESPGSAYVLSGDVYTWKAVQPGHGVVEVICVDPSWKRRRAN